MRRRSWAIVGFAVVALAAVAGLLGVRRKGPRLMTMEFGGEGPPSVVLLHGFGSSAEKWLPFTRTIVLPPRGRFIFPQAPHATVPPEGPVDGRAWWKLELAANIPPGRSVPDLSGTDPPGIRTAAALVHQLLQDLPSAQKSAVLLGGFSQGAMVASETAFLSPVPLRALILLSGTLVKEETWSAVFAQRRGLPVFLAHGRADPILPFHVADRFRRKLEAAGLVVTWVPFDGGHEIPAQVVSALNTFLRGLHLDH